MQLVALASFMPLIAAMGGNVGSQSATIVVRSLALGELKQEDWGRVTLREAAVGLLLGSFYALVVAVAAYVLYGARLGWPFALVVAISTWASMTIATTIGSFVPFALQAAKSDPATATGPIVTTVTDILATGAYLALATFLLL